MIETLASHLDQKKSDSNPEKTVIISLQINGKTFEVPLLERPEPITNLPKNFTFEIPGKLWRGSWPEQQIAGVKALDINKVVSLYSSNDAKEKAWLPMLKDSVAKTNMEHVVVDIDQNLDLLNAAITHYDGGSRTYVHCQAGANRTGLFCLVANFIEQKSQDKPLNKESLILILSKLLRGGYDFDKEKYVKYLNEIVNECIKLNLISTDLFR